VSQAKNVQEGLSRDATCAGTGDAHLKVGPDEGLRQIAGARANLKWGQTGDLSAAIAEKVGMVVSDSAAAVQQLVAPDSVA